MANNIPMADALQRFLRHADTLMGERGIQTDAMSGKPYFTGYAYKTLYDWDQYFEALVQRYLGWPAQYVQNAVEIFLSYQDTETGFIPRCIPKGGDEQYEHVKPFLAQTVLLLHRWPTSLDWLHGDNYRRLKDYLLYWLDKRDLRGQGLSVWNSAPHTGMDNQHERAGWWLDNFCEGTDLNAYLYRECLAMAQVAALVGNADDVQYFRERAKQRKEAIYTNLWDNQEGFFYDVDARTGQPIKHKSVSGFAPLWAGIVSKDHAKKLIFCHLLNPQEFWSPHPVASWARSEAGYSQTKLANDLGCNWRATTWIPTNYFIFQGLRLYGYNEQASLLARKTWQMVQRAGLREWYNAETGEGQGLDPFWGWSVLAVIMPYEDAIGYDPTAVGDMC